MAMIVRNNVAANRALSQTEKNEKTRSKSLGNLSSGMKINSAQDDSASFSISARMRTKLRSLDQDSQNVQNGTAILNTAEGGIQGQIDLLRTIREKVIDAANDHNTDEDRQTIQKEINHLYDQMESIAYGTDFNSKKPLIGDVVFDKRIISEKIVDDGTVWSSIKKLANSDLGIIPDNYGILDGIKQPFDIFTEYGGLTLVGKETMTGYDEGEYEVVSTDFSAYTDVSQLNNVGILIKGVDSSGNTYSNRYVFTDDTTKEYKNAKGVKIGNDLAETLDNLVSAIKSNSSSGINKSDVRREGTKIIVPTYNNSGTNKADITGISDTGGSGTKTVSHTGTGVGGGIRYASGGVNDPRDKDDPNVGAKATLTVDLSRASHNTGFTFNGYNFRIVHPNQTPPEGNVNITLTKGQNKSENIGSFTYSFTGNSITFTANSNGSAYNSYAFNGNSYTYTTTDNVTYTEYTAANLTKTIETNSAAKTNSSWEIDLSSMTIDEFSAQYSGKSFSATGYSGTGRFYDSSLEPKLEGIKMETASGAIYVNKQIDINNVRQRMNADSSLSFADAFKAEYSGFLPFDGDKIKFTTSSGIGSVSFYKDNLRHYDVDFAQLDGSITMPDDLYGKGFQTYCATDDVEFFNFVFTDGNKTYTSSKDGIKPINIDVSGVTNSKELVQEIYKQAMPLLTSTDPKMNHFLRLAADPDNGILTLYDLRQYAVTNYTSYQEKGAKISDGLAFDTDDIDESQQADVIIERNEKEFYGKDLVIQHTDKANMNIHIKIPQMTLDHIFTPLPIDPSTIFDYPVTDKASRDYLLGNPDPPGILDNGLTYLLDAITLVGAQTNRLAHTATNITTEIENLTASESVISDADMAKEMTEYTKSNLLVQSSQAMLAQANQIPSMVLSLLS